MEIQEDIVSELGRRKRKVINSFLESIAVYDFK